jgi:phosphoserine phosphatase RsbX
VSLEKSNPFIEWGVAMKTLTGETLSGDRHFLKFFPTGFLAVVMDGLGHGNDAAMAAETALATLEEYSREHLISLLKLCHENLRNTRGVVMSMASYNELERTMSWLGIGNIFGVLHRVNTNRKFITEIMVNRNGVVGAQYPSPKLFDIKINPGDTLILATDGIREDFIENRLLQDFQPQHMADSILNQYGKATDDNLVLVMRWMGNNP